MKCGQPFSKTLYIVVREHVKRRKGVRLAEEGRSTFGYKVKEVKQLIVRTREFRVSITVTLSLLFTHCQVLQGWTSEQDGWEDKECEQKNENRYWSGLT